MYSWIFTTRSYQNSAFAYEKKSGINFQIESSNKNAYGGEDTSEVQFLPSQFHSPAGVDSLVSRILVYGHIVAPAAAEGRTLLEFPLRDGLSAGV